MVRVLASSAKVVRPSGGLESPIHEINKWLVEDVQNAYTAGGLDRKQLLKVLGTDRMLGLIIQINSRRRRLSSPDMDRMVEDFEHHYRSKTISGALDPLGNLRLELTLLAHVKGTESIAGILDPFVDGNQDLFEKVTISFVKNQTLLGGDGESSIELEFERDLWAVAISDSMRLRMVPKLEEFEDADKLDDEDASDENRRKIAFANARASLPAPLLKAEAEIPNEEQIELRLEQKERQGGSRVKLHLKLYTKSMPDDLYAEKIVDASRPGLGNRWPIDGIEPGPRVFHGRQRVFAPDHREALFRAP
jgi:hypothetical protein